MLHTFTRFIMKTVKLSSGYDMPVVGLGTWKSKAGDVKKSVAAAIDVGYRHIDCAFIYGNEAEVGEGLKVKLDEGKVTREELFITSKLWNAHHRAEDVLPALQKSLDNLGVQYLDLYLVHWPNAFQPGGELFPRDSDGNIIFADIPLMETWKGMEACVDAGLVRSIGVSNYNSVQIQHILDNCRIKPANQQIEIHPYFTNEKIVTFCQDRGIHVTAYSPFGSPDRPWAPANDPQLLEDPKLLQLADKYKKTPAQVVLQWLLQRNIIVIPKSVTPSRITSNFQVTDFELSAEDMAVVSGFNTNFRSVVPYIYVDGKPIMRDHKAPNFPFNIEF